MIIITLLRSVIYVLQCYTEHWVSLTLLDGSLYMSLIWNHTVSYNSFCQLYNIGACRVLKNILGFSRTWFRSQYFCVFTLVQHWELEWISESLVSWESKALMLTFPGSLGGKLLQSLPLHTVCAQVAADVLGTQNVSQTRNPGQWL